MLAVICFTSWILWLICYCPTTDELGIDVDISFTFVCQIKGLIVFGFVWWDFIGKVWTLITYLCLSADWPMIMTSVILWLALFVLLASRNTSILWTLNISQYLQMLGVGGIRICENKTLGVYIEHTCITIWMCSVSARPVTWHVYPSSSGSCLVAHILQKFQLVYSLHLLPRIPHYSWFAPNYPHSMGHLMWKLNIVLPCSRTLR